MTYAALFPEGVQVVLLNGNTHPVKYCKSGEARTAMWAASADDVLNRLVTRLKRGTLPAPAANGTSLYRPS